MAEIKLPVDFERLPEFRGLQSKLLAADVPMADVDALAVFMFIRLWVDLAYQASVVKPVGLLRKTDLPLFVNGLGATFLKLDTLKLLCEAGVLREQGEGYYCERFARCNEQLSPDYRSGQVKGAEHSALARGKRRLAHEALQQAMLLPPERLKRRNGEPLVGSEINRVMLLIKTVDNCLKLPPRNNSLFTEGLMADAADVMDRYTPEQLEATYYWIIDHREHPALPKTTEQILASFSTLASLVNGA